MCPFGPVNYRFGSSTDVPLGLSDFTVKGRFRPLDSTG